MTIGQYIYKKANKKGVHIDALPQLTGIGRNRLYTITADRTLPTLDEFGALARVLDFSGSAGKKYRDEIRAGHRRYAVELSGDTLKAVEILARMTGHDVDGFVNRVLAVSVEQLTANMNMYEREAYTRNGGAL